MVVRNTTLARDTTRIPRTLTQATPARDTMTARNTTRSRRTPTQATRVRGTMTAQSTTLVGDTMGDTMTVQSTVRNTIMAGDTMGDTMAVRNTVRGTMVVRNTTLSRRNPIRATPVRVTMEARTITQVGDTMVIQDTTPGQDITLSQPIPIRVPDTTPNPHTLIQATPDRDTIRSRRRPHTTTLFLTRPSHRHLRPRDRIRQ